MSAISASVKGTKRVEKLLRQHTTTMENAMVKAINDTTKNLRTEASKIIRADLNVTKQKLDVRLRRHRAKKGKIYSTFYIMSRKPIPLGAFGGKRQGKKGVTVKVRKGGKGLKVPGAFGPKIPKLYKNVYRRVGAASYPLKIVRRPSVSLEREVRSTGVLRKVNRMTSKLLRKNLTRRIKLANLTLAKKRKR